MFAQEANQITETQLRTGLERHLNTYNNLPATLMYLYLPVSQQRAIFRPVNVVSYDLLVLI